VSSAPSSFRNFYARGGNVYNKSWQQDHKRYNKSESYEVPMANRKRKYANGGVVGQEIVIDNQGEEVEGVIVDIHNSGDYIVRLEDGRSVLAQRDRDIISFGDMAKAPMAEAPRKRFGFFGDGGGVENPSRQQMLDYLNMYFDYYSELRTIAVEEDNILTRRMLTSLDDEELEMAYDDAQYEIKSDTQYAKGGLTEHGLRVGDTIQADGKTFGYKDEIQVIDSDKKRRFVNLDKGNRGMGFGKGGKMI
jgi:hypothetical protein